MTDFRTALELIATGPRPDGTWNRDREACRQLAAEALRTALEANEGPPSADDWVGGHLARAIEAASRTKP
jgi:hypothetical protein